MLDRRSNRSAGCKRHLGLALELCEQLLSLATRDREECDHDGCLLLDAIVRDCAMKMRQEALRCRQELNNEREHSRWAQ